MIDLLSYRARKGIFYLTFLLTLAGSFYLTFNHYFTESLSFENGKHQTFLHQDNQEIDLSTHHRSKTLTLTIQLHFGTIEKYFFNPLLRKNPFQKNYSLLHFSNNRKSLLLLRKLTL